MNGKSDQGGWRATHAASSRRSALSSASSVITPQAAESKPATSVSRSEQIGALIPTSPRIAAATVPSRPCGARISTDTSSACVIVGLTLLKKRGASALECRHACQHTPELLQWRTNAQALAVDPKLADRI